MIGLAYHRPRSGSDVVRSREQVPGIHWGVRESLKVSAYLHRGSDARSDVDNGLASDVLEQLLIGE